MKNKKFDILIVVGSKSDLPIIDDALLLAKRFNISVSLEIVSAHRTPEKMYKFAKNAIKYGNVIIAVAGGAAHLPGMIASLTTLPVIGVPAKSKNLNGIDSLLSIVQMPKGIPVASLAIGDAGAANAGLFAAQILSVSDPELHTRLKAHRAQQAAKVLEQTL